MAELPDSVYRRLKIRAMDRGISMRAVLIELINESAESAETTP